MTRAPRQVTRDAPAADPRVPGRSKHDPVLVTRTIDVLSPRLLGACASGELLPRVDLVLTAPAPGADDARDEVPWFRLELTDVLVTSVLASLEDDGPLETVAFDYGAVRWVHLDGADTHDAHWSVHGPPR
ncbi:MAG: type VI secretion system tube protein Hcp [Alphaproteobacteria bacterium]|nr:type VI secretion system tube protein Hcp [Alphaproteobacteria bacterium]